MLPSLAHLPPDTPCSLIGDQLLVDPAWSNGSGNYIRAEALHRAGVNPFSRARDVIQQLIDDPKFDHHATQLLKRWSEVEKLAMQRIKPFFDAYDAGQDLAPLESSEPRPLSALARPLGVLGAVAEVACEAYLILDRYGFDGDRDHRVFMAWLQAYMKLGNTKDDIGRTMWCVGFFGDVPEPRFF